MSGERFRVADNGGGVLGGIGEGLQRMGGAVSQFAEVKQHIEDQQNDATAKAADNQFVAGAQPIRSTFMSQYGLNAASGRAAADKALGDLRAATLKTVEKKPKLVAMLKPLLDQRLTSMAGEFEAHTQQQMFVANDEASAARINLAREDAASTTDPAARTKAIQTGLGEIMGRAQAKGLPADWTAAEGLKFESGVHRAVVEQMLTADKIDDAVAYRDAHKDRINGADEAAIDTVLHAPLQRREENAYVDGIMGSATAGERSAPFTYADPLHGVGRKPVPGGRFNAARDYGSHHGVDIPAPLNAPVYAAAAGVVKTSHSPLGGNIVTVTHDDGLVTRYMHLGAFKVKDGDRVGPDTALGVVGVTGRSSGPHLHYEMVKDGKPINPDKAIGTVQQSPQRHDLNRLLATVDADRAAGRISPEQADRYKTEIDRRVGRDETLMRRTEDDAQRAALDAITRIGPDKFTDISQLPANVRGSLGIDKTLEFMKMAQTNARALVTGATTKANSDTVINLHQLAQLDPDAFKKRDLRLDRPNMTAGEYDQLATTQAGMLAKPNSAAEISHTKIWSTISRFAADVGLDLGTKGGKPNNPKDRADSMRLFSAMQSTLQAITDGKRAPTDDEIKKAFDNAVMPVAHTKSGWFSDSTEMVPRFRDGAQPTNSIAVPKAAHDRIAAGLRARNLPYDDQSVARFYIQAR